MEKNIMILVPKLGLGGAELFLLNLIPNLQKEFKVNVACIDGKGVLSPKYKREDISVEYLNFLSIFSLPRIMYKIINLIRDKDIHIVHSFLYPSDFLTIFIKIFFQRKIKIVWSLRLSKLPSTVKWTSKLLRTFVIIFSRFTPNMVVSCSQESLDYHKKVGYDTSRTLVIPNFPADWTKAIKSQSSLLLKTHPDEITIGLAARFTPGKGHDLLCEVLRINQNDKEASFKLKASFCGIHSQPGGDLFKLILDKYSDIFECCSFNGQIIDIDYQSWLSSIDLYTLTSDSLEGNPNSFLEAATIGTPTVGANIGSSNLMVAPECLIPQNVLSAITLYDKIKFWLNMDIKQRLNVIEENKRLVNSNFDKNNIIKSYVESYKLLTKD